MRPAASSSRMVRSDRIIGRRRYLSSTPLPASAGTAGFGSPSAAVAPCSPSSRWRAIAAHSQVANRPTEIAMNGTTGWWNRGLPHNSSGITTSTTPRTTTMRRSGRGVRRRKGRPARASARTARKYRSAVLVSASRRRVREDLAAAEPLGGPDAVVVGAVHEVRPPHDLQQLAAGVVHHPRERLAGTRRVPLGLGQVGIRAPVVGRPPELPGGLVVAVEAQGVAHVGGRRDERVHDDPVAHRPGHERDHDHHDRHGRDGQRPAPARPCCEHRQERRPAAPGARRAARGRRPPGRPRRRRGGARPAGPRTSRGPR